MTVLPDSQLPSTIPQEFARQVAISPDRTALVCDQVRLTYFELDLVSTAFAHQLLARGAGPGTVVPVRLPRDWSLPVAMLAVAKAGAAYCVLDPAWPAETCREMALSLTGQDPVILAPLGTDLGFDMPSLDELLTAPKRALESSTTPAATAAVVLTSGSTGAPKAVAVPHRGITRLFGRGGGPWPSRPTVPAASAVAWDGFSWELWGALLSSGTAVLVSDPFLDPGRLRELVRLEGVDTVFLITSLFNVFVDADLDAFTGLDAVHIAGEAPSVRHVSEFVAAHPAIRLFNLYGPAECSIATSWHQVTSNDVAAGEIPMGRPFALTGMELLDRDGTLVTGEGDGELVLEGPALFSGYLGSPEATAASIVACADGVARYRTGDVAYRRGDGELVFRGRVDNQVKINGRRVELEGVEASLLSCPEVEMAVAFVATNSGGHPYLAATVSGSSADERALRAELSSRVPEYLVPSRIVVKDRLALTSNGKPDRAAAMESFARASGSLTPTTHTPRLSEGAGAPVDRVCALFEKITGLTCEPGVPFLEAGGTSVQLPKLAAALRREFDVPVRVADVLKWATPDRIAQELG